MPVAPTVLPNFADVAKWGWSIAFLIALLIVPAVTVGVATVALIAQLALLALSAMGRRHVQAVASTLRPDVPRAVFLSVQVPACREPPEVLIGTLESLKDQSDAVPHEVIVIVNNTPDPAQWQPIKTWCAQAGAPFRFMHCENVRGAKAGALNIALAACNPLTTHVVTVDADYQVERSFLRDVGADIAAGDSAFYQYPQAYRNVTPASAGIARELEDYFKRQALAANLGQAMLLTGTLSVISKSALQSVGGWPTSSCTEDAALGTLLIEAGYHGIYVDRVLGRGLMPLDVAGLHKQRYRWASGNARVLVQCLPKLMRHRSRLDRAALFRAMLIVSQLTAWLNLGAIAVVTLCVGLWHLAGAEAGLAREAGLAQSAIWVSVATLLATVAAALPLLANGAVRGDPPGVRITAFWSRIAMLPVAAWATIVGLLPVVQRFQVTAKTLTRRGGQDVSGPVLASAAVAVCIVGANAGTLHLGPLAAAALMVLPFVGSVASARALRL